MRACLNNIDGSLADYYFIEAVMYNCDLHGLDSVARPVTHPAHDLIFFSGHPVSAVYQTTNLPV